MPEFSYCGLLGGSSGLLFGIVYYHQGRVGNAESLVVDFSVPLGTTSVVWIDICQVAVVDEENGPESGGKVSVIGVPNRIWFWYNRVLLYIGCDECCFLHLLLSDNRGIPHQLLLVLIKVFVEGSNLTICLTDTRWWCWSCGGISFLIRLFSDADWELDEVELWCASGALDSRLLSDDSSGLVRLGLRCAPAPYQHCSS